MVALAGLNSRWEAFAQLLTLLVVFIFVLALTYFATRWAGNMQKTKMAGRNIQILETMRVSNTKYIQIIKIGSKCFAVAVCKDTITYLSEINEQELTYSSESKTINTDGFKAILEKFKKLNSHPRLPFCKRVSHFESDLQILYPTFHFCNDFPVFFLAFMI